jgi:enamine deaminase RidA (YjgF/YER057c/UK114 family)
MNSRFLDAFIRYELIPAGAIAAADDYVLGLHCLGKKGSLDKKIAATSQRIPTQQISTPILDRSEDSLHERWLTNTPCRDGQFHDIAFRCSDSLLFGVIEIDESTLTVDSEKSRLRIAADTAYRQIFSLLEVEGFSHLWRTWNYMADIHAEECGLERYRQFNIGRHDAFVGCSRPVDRSPAASALGTRDGLFSVAFIAGRFAPTRIENPRQVSAFDYPAQYGPCSPTFTRAATVNIDNYEALFVSGTASIVGHETLHRDDVAAQTRETVANLAALLDQANNASPQSVPFTLPQLNYRVYVRHANDFTQVHTALSDAIGTSLQATYVQADICRQDLLIEIEAFAIRPSITLTA